MDDHDILNRPRIMYSCYFKLSREGEQFIPEHVFSYIKSGSLLINDVFFDHRDTGKGINWTQDGCDDFDAPQSCSRM